jgi:hypothetical protein
LARRGDDGSGDGEKNEKDDSGDEKGTVGAIES